MNLALTGVDAGAHELARIIGELAKLSETGEGMDAEARDLAATVDGVVRTSRDDLTVVKRKKPRSVDSPGLFELSGAVRDRLE